MADLISILSNAAVGMSAHRAATQVATHNIQNANTPGYSRQRAELMSRGAEFYPPNSFLGLGVDIGTVTQARDRFLEAQMPSSLAADARSSAQAEALEAVHALDPDQPGGLSDAMSRFYSTARALSQNAGDLGLRQDFYQAVRSVAGAFNSAATAVESARDGLDATVESTLDTINQNAVTVAALNLRITQARAAGAPPNDLLDSRQIAIDKLAELTGGVPVPDSEGRVSIMLPGGMSLVSGVAAGRLSAIADASNGGHLAVRFEPAGGAPPLPLTAERLGGKLAGLFDARDGALLTAANQLDQLAVDFHAQVTAPQYNGFGLGGTTFIRMFDDLPGTYQAALNIKVFSQFNPSTIGAASTAASVPGDATNLLATLDTERAILTGGQNVSGTIGRIVAEFGGSTARARALADHDANVRGHLEEMRESVNGVSIDEEMINLTKSQRAYEAVLKVITTADKMLETLMQLR